MTVKNVRKLGCTKDKDAQRQIYQKLLVRIDKQRKKDKS